MRYIARKLGSAARHPRLAAEYVGWLIASARAGGKPSRTLFGGIEIGGFANFSEYHSLPGYVPDTEQRIFENTPIGDGAIIDVGANMGLVSLLLARRFPDRTIHAFEPNPSTFATLEDNLARNKAPHVVCHRMAVCDAGGTIMFDNDPVNRATASISFSENALSTAVPAITLDSFLEAHRIDSVALLKIDVEGFETLVLSGASRMLAEKRAVSIYFEVCPFLTRRAGFDPAAPAQMLLDAGYKLSRLTESGAIKPAKIADIGEIVLENWLAVPG